MSSDEVNKIANYNQMMSWLTRQEFKVGGRVEIPGLDEKVEELFKEGLSNNQVLEKLKETPKFEKVTIGVVKRIKKEKNLGGQREAQFASQADKYNELKNLVKQANDQSKFVEMQSLRAQVGLPAKVAATDYANYEKFNIPKLDTASDKITKAFNKIINNPDIPAENVFDITSRIANETGLSMSTASETLNTLPEYQDFKSTALKLQNPAFKTSIVGKDKTLGDVMQMADQTSSSGTSLSGPNTPERFIFNSIKRHIAQGGDKVEWIKAPGSFDQSGQITETDAVFRYKGNNYDYYDLVQNGRNIDDFKEVYKVYDDMNDLLSREAINPMTNEKITFKELMQKAYSKGANLSSINPYEVDHFGSVKNQPFSNLRILPYRINRVQGLLKNKADQAKAGFLKPETAKMYTPEKIKNYLQKSGYNFTKNIDQIFKDEVKLANEILVEGRVLRTPIEIGKSIEEQKFTKLLDIPGVKRASEIERPEAAVERDMFKAFNERISLQKNIPVKEVKEDVSEVSKVLKNITNKMGSGVDPTDIVKYIAAEAKDLAAFGKKYGGDILKDVAEKEQSLLGKIGTGAIKTIGALDLPIMQVAFGSMQNWEEDSPLWVTLPAAFTDEIADAFNLYKKTGGKAKEFGKFLASSFVPRAARSPLFKAVSKVGKVGSVATPLLEAGQEAYKFEKQKRMLPEIARQFNIPIEEARKGFENYIRSTIQIGRAHV